MASQAVSVIADVICQEFDQLHARQYHTAVHWSEDKQ